MPKPDFGMIDWTDAQLDERFLRAEARPLDGFLNSGDVSVDLATHEMFNDRRWRGFMPKDLPVTDVTDRLSLGFAKKLWQQKGRFGGETQYYGGRIVTRHTVSEITLEQQTHDLPPGKYVLLGYTDRVFERLFYDLLKPIDDDVMLFRGYTGQFPDGRRGWTALLLRRYPFSAIGIDDSEVLFERGAAPTEAELIGEWRLDVIYYSNPAVPVARLTIGRSDGGSLQVRCEPTGGGPGPLLGTLLQDHFTTERLAALQQEIRTVDRQYLVGQWTTNVGGASKFLLAGSPGLFHRGQGRGRSSRYTLFYLLTRVS